MYILNIYITQWIYFYVIAKKWKHKLFLYNKVFLFRSSLRFFFFFFFCQLVEFLSVFCGANNLLRNVIIAEEPA